VRETLAEVIRGSRILGCDCCSDIECTRPECVDEDGFEDHYNVGCNKNRDRADVLADVVLAWIAENR
jgi:hypothetical protein